MGDIPFVFAVAPQHPLAHQPGPLSLEQVRGYRAVVAADSSRRLPPRSSPLLAGQETLTVPDMDAKLMAQAAGLGVNAGHDLSQANLAAFLAGAPGVLEVSIGHALISEALYEGLDATVRAYRRIVDATRAADRD